MIIEIFKLPLAFFMIPFVLCAEGLLQIILLTIQIIFLIIQLILFLWK